MKSYGNVQWYIPFIVMVVGIWGRAIGAETRIDNEHWNQIIQQLSAANSGITPPAFGTAKFRYEKWSFPRYSSESGFKEQVRLQYDLLDKEKSKMSEKQVAETREAIPFNMTSQYMNTSYSIFDVDYAFDNDKLRLDRRLVSHKSDVVLPESLRGNSRIRYFDPAGNQVQVYAWDGKNQRRILQVDQNGTQHTAFLGTVRDEGMETPPLRINAPPLAQLKDHIRAIREIAAADKTPKYEVVLGIEDREIVATYDKATGQLQSTEIKSSLGDEVRVFRELVQQTKTKEGTPIPGITEYVELWTNKGEQEPRVVTRRKWMLVEGSFSAHPSPDQFAPVIPDNTEVHIYHGTTQIVEFVKGREQADHLEKMVQEIGAVDPSNAQRVSEIASKWDPSFHKSATSPANVSRRSVTGQDMASIVPPQEAQRTWIVAVLMASVAAIVVCVMLIRARLSRRGI